MLRHSWFKFLIVVAVGFSLYSFMLSSPFKTMDDRYSIVSNPLIKDTKHIKQIFTQGYFNDRSYYRPLVNLSFMGEYHLFGLDPFFYNLDNLILHIINALLVWCLVGLILNNVTLGFWAGLLFVMHPIHCEAVNNISGRAILLSSMFILSSFSLLILYTRSSNKIYYALAMVSFGMALLCKESSIVFPGVIFIYWVYQAVPLQRAMFRAIPMALLSVAYLGLRHVLGITQLFTWANAAEQFLGFITFLRSLLTHVKLFLFPIGLHFDRSQRLFLSLNDPECIATIVIWVGLAIGCWLLRHRAAAIVWFCLGWVLLELFPVSQMVTSLGVSPGIISAADHFLYLASIPGLILLLLFIQGNKMFSPTAVKFLAGTFLAFFCLMNVEQNIYASNELKMLERSISIQPNNARLQSSVGYIYASAGKIQEAQNHFILALTQEPWNPRYRISVAKTLCDQGRYQDCLGMYSQIDNPGPFAKLLRENIEAAKRLWEQSKKHDQLLPQ